MRSYVISTDSSADLSEAYLKEHQITMISLSCILNGKTYNSENPITPKQLYDNIREGAMPTTSQVNPEQAKAAFEPLLKEGKDILHIAFSLIIFLYLVLNLVVSINLCQVLVRKNL